MTIQYSKTKVIDSQLWIDEANDLIHLKVRMLECDEETGRPIRKYGLIFKVTPESLPLVEEGYMYPTRACIHTNSPE